MRCRCGEPTTWENGIDFAPAGSDLALRALNMPQLDVTEPACELIKGRLDRAA